MSYIEQVKSNKRVKKFFLGSLHKMIDPKFTSEMGVCSEIILIGRPISQQIRGEVFAVKEEFLNECFKSWDEFSGNINFPVPVLSDMEIPEKVKDRDDPEWIAGFAYCSGINGHNLDKWSGEYGETRRRLVRHIINILES